jgi:CO/xanthine dehydrogenase FAD-binding subunit
LQTDLACTAPDARYTFPSLAAAIRSVGSRHVRNTATLGGNLNLPTRCWYTNQSESWRLARPPCLKIGGEVCYVIRSANACFALNSVDSAPALMTLNARLNIAGPHGTRELRIADFYRDDGLLPTVLEPAEILTAVHVPAHLDRTVFIKIAPRTGLDYGLGTIAAAVTGSNRRVTSARMVVGSVASRPVPLTGASRLIEQGGLNEEAISAAAEAARADLDEITNLYSPAGYKRRLVRALVRRALTELRGQQLAAEAA